MQADGVAGRNNSTRDDVVAVHQGASDGLADAIDVNRRSGDESDDEADGGSQQSWDHQHTEPTDIETVVGAGDPLAKRFPSILGLLSCKCSHFKGLYVRPKRALRYPNIPASP